MNSKHALSDYHHPCLIHSKEIKKKYHDDIGNIPLGDIRKVVFHMKDHLKSVQNYKSLFDMLIYQPGIMLFVRI